MHALAVDEITDLKKAILKVHIFGSYKLSHYLVLPYLRNDNLTDSLAEYNGIYDSFRSTYVFLLSHYNDRDAPLSNIFTMAS